MKRTIGLLLLLGAAIFCGAGCLKLQPKGDDGPPRQDSSDMRQQGGSDAAAGDPAASRDAAANRVPSGKSGSSSEFAGSGVESRRSFEGIGEGAQDEPAPQQPAETARNELLPQSNDRKLARSDLAGLSNWRLTLARNEIYARHGRPFSNPAIRAYFMGTGWYAPNSGFSESSLDTVEQQNAAFIRDYQAGAFGSPATKPGGAAPRPQPVALGEILPQSNDRKLARNDLAGLSNWRLTLARNEIYARHGRPFDNANIRSYFMSTGWYSPNSDFRESWVTSLESQNAEFIRSYQARAYGSPATRP